MPQGEHIKLHIKRHGRRMDHEERMRKREARAPTAAARKAKKLIGLRGILYSEQRRKEKIEMRKKIRQHEEKDTKSTNKDDNTVSKPAYLLDRETENRAKILSNQVKQKKKTRAAVWDVPISKVQPLADAEVFKVLRSGKRANKMWKRKITMATFQAPGFTRKAPKYERFIKPAALRYRHCNVTHPELKVTH